MAADSPKKSVKSNYNVTRPQAFSEKSVMESVVDFISDVVPQAYTGSTKCEDKERIQWVHFANSDINDVSSNPDLNTNESKGVPLLLILGYGNGVQVWNIATNGEAQEILSLRQGPIRIFKVLPSPTQVFEDCDQFHYKRPLAVLCDSTSAGQPYCSVKFVSLRTGDEVHNVSFKTHPVLNIECNKRVIVVAFQEKLSVFDACSLRQLFWVMNCFPNTGPNINPIALGTRWLAYADKRLVPMHQSCGGMSGDGSQSYAATVISAARGAFKGLTMFGEAMVHSVTGTKPSPTPKKSDSPPLDNGHRPGIVSIIDTQTVIGDHVVDMCFSHDSRWVTVSSHRGTTHLFPITPYGGPINTRTHCSPRIVNRASRFHKSAGLDEMDHSTGRNSPVQNASSSPTSSGGQYDNYPSLLRHNALNNSIGNPRLPPYPHPITVYPLAQIKQPLMAGRSSSKTGSPSHIASDNWILVTACFSTPRVWVGGCPNLSVDRREGKRAADSLFLMSQTGTLVEYVLDPKSKQVTEKITDGTPLDLTITGYTQWHLQRSKTSDEVRPPLVNNNPLFLASDAVMTQRPSSCSDGSDLFPVTRQDSRDSLTLEQENRVVDQEEWLSQVEIITHVGPHRRLWMGPQFSFKTYQNVQNTTVLSSQSSALLSQSPEVNLSNMDVTSDEVDLESLKIQPARSSPVAMPNARPAYRRTGSDTASSPGRGSTPLLIEAGSFDQSPNLCDVYSSWAESTVAKQPKGCEELDEKMKENLAEAMLESPMKEGGPSSISHDAFIGSNENLSTSSGSSIGLTREHAMDPMFNTSNESPDSS
ncbi:BCAS3 microtubule associated cell migration factor-like isoform X2 [Ostrea edulis]|uniref:BCAS3 microtubule associated cell migration factor-like isoform X2 n=1 Tax=Ostrea edulis TaxID=37623 RepID=UPI0024AF2189|nr:BCAS3 microtubule associated cell migration factor-like isoform X2 [Ostrea edulis]